MRKSVLPIRVSLFPKSFTRGVPGRAWVLGVVQLGEV